MVAQKSNIILIGMAGCGKSSIGKLLAKKLNKPFIDTDDLIVKAQGRPLQEIIDTEGSKGFRRIEESVLLALNVHDHVIATGGSAVYSIPGMGHLINKGVVIYLHASVDILKKRVGDTKERGLVKRSDQNFEDLYAERRDLYVESSEITVDCSHLDHEGVCRKIIDELKQSRTR